jgi:hypothetical protein
VELDKFVTVGGMVFVLALYGLAFWVAFYLIKTAVKSGVREAIVLAETDLKRVVRLGVADALAEHDTRGRAKVPAGASQESPAQ